MFIYRPASPHFSPTHLYKLAYRLGSGMAQSAPACRIPPPKNIFVYLTTKFPSFKNRIDFVASH